MIVGFGRVSGVSITSKIYANMGLHGLVGYKWFHTPSFGQRLYVDISFGFLPDSFNTHDLALNYDLLLNFVSNRGFKFGMLFGLNIGSNIIRADGTTITTFAIGRNIGFRFGIFKNHSIEILGQTRMLFGKYNPTKTSYCNYYNGCVNLYSINPGISILGLLRYVHTY